MSDNVFFNKYLVIALIIILVVVIYLYYQKKSCDVEGMNNVDLTTLAHEMHEKPWSSSDNNGPYKSVNNDFDLYADNITRKKLGRKKFLQRKDELYQKYMLDDNDTSDDYPNLRKSKRYNPKPINYKHTLGRFQPYFCQDDNEKDDDDEYQVYRPIRRRRYHKKLNKY
jgi:hypothetical protein